MQLALYQPDIPQNTGTILRLCTCMGVPCHIIEPCGFVWNDRKLARSGMDYLQQADITRHNSWGKFLEWTKKESSEEQKALQGDVPSSEPETNTKPQLILLTTQSSTPYTDFSFHRNNILLLGRESAGAPPEVHDACDARLTIPMQPGTRSLNVAISAAMVLGEALRQTRAG